ncbi:MAG TPA: alpha/beta hydrolase [Rhizomicrobium sp.]|jgi:acetyl esterase|nr:alpha/beta hydrolase [Rhizomicrobium sp.]
MPLDPLLKAFLDQLAAQPQPKLWETEPSAARELFVAFMQAVGPKDVPIGKITSLSIPGPAGNIPARSYSPIASGSEPQPALVFFHGGGFVIGSIDTHDGLCRMLANLSGCRVISVEYRLAPEHRFPAAVDDALVATSWIELNAAQLGVDANRLAVGGDSAGATLAAVVAQMTRDKGAPKLAFQMLLFPGTDVAADTDSKRMFASGYFLDGRDIDWFSDHYFGPEANRAESKASPLLAESFAGLPPAYLMVAGFDPLRDEAIAYAEKLRAAGVAVTLDDYPNMVHDFIYFQAVLPQAADALNSAANALKTALIPG